MSQLYKLWNATSPIPVVGKRIFSFAFSQKAPYFGSIHPRVNELRPNYAEVIVPNGLLIAGRVTNWTLSNRQRGFDVAVSVGPGVEPAAVIELLQRVARDVKSVAASPPPQAYVTEFLAAGGLKFELRAWADRFDDWVQARSELVAAVHKALADAGIARV